jgi:hypothetical protein
MLIMFNGERKATRERAASGAGWDEVLERCLEQRIG